MWVNNSGPIAMHESYKNDESSCKNTFGVKKVQPSKVARIIATWKWMHEQIGDNKIWYQNTAKA